MNAVFSIDVVTGQEENSASPPTVALLFCLFPMSCCLDLKGEKFTQSGHQKEREMSGYYYESRCGGQKTRKPRK